jgi:hypothetical protein
MRFLGLHGFKYGPMSAYDLYGCRSFSYRQCAKASAQGQTQLLSNQSDYDSVVTVWPKWQQRVMVVQK